MLQALQEICCIRRLEMWKASIVLAIGMIGFSLTAPPARAEDPKNFNFDKCVAHKVANGISNAVAVKGCTNIRNGQGRNARTKDFKGSH
jgi:hypothetical protein